MDESMLLQFEQRQCNICPTVLKKISPGPINGDQFLDGLGLDEGACVFRAVGDDLVNGIEDGHHSVLLQVLGWSLLTAGQVAHQVPHGVTSYTAN